MNINVENHPCFNEKKRHEVGRVHLPVAPRCNVQCNFCDRKFDCMNESRPGVTSRILTPEQALAYVDTLMEAKKNITVVGIAGPGDPFANPKETMETLRLVREKYPEMILCVATNGLALEPYIDELAELKVSHVTITVNGIDPQITAKVYSWMRYGKKVYSGPEAGAILLEEQIKSVLKLKQKGIIVKINSIIIKGINDFHIPAIAKEFAALGADIMNSIPHYPVKGTLFENLEEPDKTLVKNTHLAVGEHLPVMHHCTRCRADAVGLLGETTTVEDFIVNEPAQKKGTYKIGSNRPNIAIGTREGLLVNQHLGEAEHFSIYGMKDGKIELLERRALPERGLGDDRWLKLAETLSDCSFVLVNGAGPNPLKILKEQGITVIQLDALINEALESLYNGKDMSKMEKRFMGCMKECSGTGGGCG